MTAKIAAIAAINDRTTAIHAGVVSTLLLTSEMSACNVPTSVSIVATFPSMEVTVPSSVPRVVLTVATSPESEVTLASRAETDAVTVPMLVLIVATSPLMAVMSTPSASSAAKSKAAISTCTSPSIVAITTAVSSMA